MTYNFMLKDRQLVIILHTSAPRFKIQILNLKLKNVKWATTTGNELLSNRSLLVMSLLTGFG